MTLKDVKIGEKFLLDDYLYNTPYLKINFDLSSMLLTMNSNGFVCALDLNTYQIVVFNEKTKIIKL